MMQRLIDCSRKLLMSVRPVQQCLTGIPSGGSRVCLHSAAVLFTLDKDMRGKDQLIRTSQAAKLEPVVSKDVADVVDVETKPFRHILPGFTDAGITIPTLETHATLVDGVRYDELPILNIKSTMNNTHISLSDHTTQKVYVYATCGTEGFKNVKKSTTIAAQTTGLAVGTRGIKKGIHTVRVIVRGVGAGRLPAIKGVQMSGIKILSITDETPIPHNGPRPRKAKRL